MPILEREWISRLSLLDFDRFLCQERQKYAVHLKWSTIFQEDADLSYFAI